MVGEGEGIGAALGEAAVAFGTGGSFQPELAELNLHALYTQRHLPSDAAFAAEFRPLVGGGVEAVVDVHRAQFQRQFVAQAA